jgi:hypothetical protein
MWRVGREKEIQGSTLPKKKEFKKLNAKRVGK